LSVKAVGLLSSGLDSPLAIRLVLDQGVEVTGVNLVLPFASEKEDYASRTAARLGIRLVKVEAGQDYIELIRSPKHGYGRGLNPCVDCRIYMLRQAKQVADHIGAEFVITGDVLGQRPKSQNEAALRLEEREAGLLGRILRPLSAGLLPQTLPEINGWIDRSRLLHIKGKRRKAQLELARRYGIEDYHFPSSGCLLTRTGYTRKLKELFDHKQKVTAEDIELLRVGRHFHCPGSWIVIGRNEAENHLLLEIKGPGDYVFAVPGFGSPITVLQGDKGAAVIKTAAELTARYSDADTREVLVEYEVGGVRRGLVVEPDGRHPRPLGDEEE